MKVIIFKFTKEQNLNNAVNTIYDIINNKDTMINELLTKIKEQQLNIDELQGIINQQQNEIERIKSIMANTHNLIQTEKKKPNTKQETPYFENNKIITKHVFFQYFTFLEPV